MKEEVRSAGVCVSCPKCKDGVLTLYTDKMWRCWACDAVATAFVKKGYIPSIKKFTNK